MSDFFLLLPILVCIILEGLFSGGEMALIAADVHRIRQKSEAGSKRAAIALRLIDNPEWFLATCLTGTDLCVITSTALATSLSIAWLGPVRGEWVSVAVMIPIILIFGEIVPKSYFRRSAERKAVIIAPFIWVSSRLLYPLVYVVSKIARGTIYVLAGERGKTAVHYITKDGLKHLLHDEARQSDVRRSEKEMVDRIFDFSETRVGKVMVPVSNVAALEEEDTFGDALQLINETGFSRFPVFQEDRINVVGLVNAFDILKAMPDSASRPVRDEYDKRERACRRLGAGQYLVNARIGIERLQEIVPLSIPEGPYETLAGYLLHQMGRVPRRMEQFREGSVQFVIEDADMKSIKQVQIVLTAGASAAKKEEGPPEPQRPPGGP